jgi:tetratricopeptide (TPR) repeat protein
MNEAVARFPNSGAAREAYARKLLARGDEQALNDAISHVMKLRELAPESSAAFELTIRLSSKRGRHQQALALLRQAIPKIDPSKPIDGPLQRRLLLCAGLLIELKDLDSAEKIYRDLVAGDPTKTYDLAMFLGMHRSVDQCFEQLNAIYQLDRVPQILGVALAVVREKRDQVGEKHDAELERWLEHGLRENPDSIALLMLQADLYDIQKRYDEAAEIYGKLLGRSDLVGLRRAIVLNNLSYLVALAGSSAARGVDALKLVNEAADILGPNSDILDTRAVVRNSRGEFQAAIEDLTDAVTDNPTPAKYFHLTEAYLGAKQPRDAVEAWEQAELLGLTRESLNRMEHEKYEDLKRQIEQIRGAVTQTPSRRAG